MILTIKRQKKEEVVELALEKNNEGGVDLVAYKNGKPKWIATVDETASLYLFRHQGLSEFGFQTQLYGEIKTT